MVTARRDGTNLLINEEKGGSVRTDGMMPIRLGSVLRTIGWALAA
jgi:hypothetical protein